MLTAIGNDYGYEDVFSRQVWGLGREGDVFVAISTSGKSPNILKAVDAAHDQRMHTIAMTATRIRRSRRSVRSRCARRPARRRSSNRSTSRRRIRFAN